MNCKRVFRRCHDLLFYFYFSEPRQHLIFLGKYICVKWYFVPPFSDADAEGALLRTKRTREPCWINSCEQLIISLKYWY